MRRGEIWTVSGGPDYAGKPRPAVIVQDDRYAATASVIVCPFTTNPTQAPDFRLSVMPSLQNGLSRVSRLMVDKVAGIPRAKLGKHLGQLADADIARLESALLVMLGMAR